MTDSEIIELVRQMREAQRNFYALSALLTPTSNGQKGGE